MITINIQGSASKFALQVEPEDSIQAVKEKIIDQSPDKPVLDQLRLIYSGQILKNEKSLLEYNIKEGHTLHLVKRASNSATPSSPVNQPQVQSSTQQTQAMPPLSAFTGDMNIQHLLQQTTSNAASNASSNATTFGAGGFRQMDPNQLRLGMQMLRANPELMRSMLQAGPLAGSGLNEEMLQMLLDPARIEEFLQAFTDPVSGNVVMPDMPAAGTGNPLSSMSSSLMMPPTAGQPAAASSEPPEVRYASQLASLNEMGFWDAEENIRALQLTGGNVHAAIERLLSKPQQ